MKINLSPAIFIFCILYATFGLCETRDEVRNQEIKSENEDIFEDNFKSDEKRLADAYSRSKQLGLYNDESDRPFPKNVGQFLVDSILGQEETVSYVLVLKALCEIPDSLIPILVKNKLFKWEIVGLEKQLHGQVHSDVEGYLRMRFSSKEDLSNRQIKLKHETFEKSISLLSGPHEIFLPSQFCLPTK